jgi:DNA repair protein RAD7
MVKPSSGFKFGLVHVKVSGAASLTDNTTEALAATCATSLEELDVSFCPRVTERGLGWLVDTVGE